MSTGWLLLLVLLAAAGAAFVWMRRRPAPSPPSPRLDPADDSLGVSAVRPASPRSSVRPEPTPRRTEPERAAAPRPEPTRDRPEMDEVVWSDGAVSAPRPARPRTPSLADNAPWSGDAVPHLLASLAAHAKGTVAVVRHDGAVFRVDARSDGGPLTRIRGRALDLDGPAALGPDDLGGLGSLVDGHAWAYPLGERVVLVSGDAEHAEPYLDLLAALTDGTAVAHEHRADAVADLSPDEPTQAGDLGDDVDGSEGAAPVPRAVIIGQEQSAAREAGRPLAFALVTLADAEDRLTSDTPEAVAVAEAELRNRLEDADATSRVEPFGDLLFGAFLDLDPEGAAAWCGTLASGEPPLFIGAVAPADGDPEAVRDAAAAALRDAYDQQRARVVEVE